MKTNLIERLEQAHSVYDQQISKARTVEFVEQLLEVLFPGFGKKHGLAFAEIEWSFEKLEKELLYLLRTVNPAEERQNIFRVTQFFEKLENVYLLLLLDVKAISEGDPAAKDEAEVIQSYPGFFAIAVYRIAHLLWNLEIERIPRILTEYAHQKTGIDIHPAAKIGESFCIDHGTGIVIGETTEIGKKVKIYQGVTLGALSVSRKLVGAKRHPSIEDNVVIYAGATILGGATVIGQNSVIGGNSWITESIAANSTVFHSPTTIIKERKHGTVN